MAEFKSLSERESQGYFLKRGQMDLTQYESFLSSLKSGDMAQATPQDGESEHAIKRRLTVAAKDQGKQLQYSKRAPEGSVVFRVK
jgi:hypothetical protein